MQRRFTADSAIRPPRSRVGAASDPPDWDWDELDGGAALVETSAPPTSFRFRQMALERRRRCKSQRSCPDPIRGSPLVTSEFLDDRRPYTYKVTNGRSSDLDRAIEPMDVCGEESYRYSDGSRFSDPAGRRKVAGRPAGPVSLLVPRRYDSRGELVGSGSSFEDDGTASPPFRFGLRPFSGRLQQLQDDEENYDYVYSSLVSPADVILSESDAPSVLKNRVSDFRKENIYEELRDARYRIPGNLRPPPPLPRRPTTLERSPDPEAQDVRHRQPPVVPYSQPQANYKSYNVNQDPSRFRPEYPGTGHQRRSRSASAPRLKRCESMDLKDAVLDARDRRIYRVKREGRLLKLPVIGYLMSRYQASHQNLDDDDW